MIVKKLRLILDIQLTLVKSKSAYLERLSSSRPENLANSPPRAKRVRRMRNERLRAAGTFMVTSGPGYTWPIAS